MTPSRRELLAAFLGLPAVLAGCSAKRPPLPEGEIVGPSDGLGHRLRDGWRPRPTTWEEKPVVIVGGGVAGLAAAWRLRREGFDNFVLLELERDAGGTARSGRGPTGAYPWGAHYVPAPLAHHQLVIELLKDLGAIEGFDADGTPQIAEEILCRDPHERIYYRGRWYEGLYLHAGQSDDDVRQFRQFRQEIDRWVAWRDGRGRRAFTVPAALSSDDPEVTALDRETVADWLGRQGFTSPRLLWLLDYACRDDYGTTPDHTSAWAGLFYFAARMKAAGVEAQPLMTWPEGNGRFVRHFAQRAREQIRAGWAASEIVPGQPKIEVTAVSATGEAIGLRTERVICAAPRFVTRHLVRDFRTDPPAYFAEFEYGSWAVANLHLSDRPTEIGFPMAWDNVLYESPSLGYVVNTHQLGQDEGPTTLTWYYPLCDADAKAARARLLESSWHDWAEIALADLSLPHANVRELATRLDVMRWGHAMVRPLPGFIWGQGRRQAALPYRGIHFAGADLSGLALFEEALYHGVRAAEEVLGARGELRKALV
ncbi:MAG: FAD-dependent oxidoreductase [Gemmataceae bacterium]